MRAPLVAAVLCAVLLVPAAASAARSPRIVNGTTSSTEELPYVAGLMIAIKGAGDNRPDALCGGSLIAARYIVTAAHCLAEEEIDPANSYAVLGSTSLDAAPAATRYPFASFFVSKGYATGGGGYDVGIVQLSRPAPQPQLRLLQPSETAAFAGGAAALTAGWGFTEDQADGGALSTGQLRKVDLQVYSDQQCQQAFEDAGQGNGLDFSTELCALAPNKDSCNGDSGGPLIVLDATGLPALAGAVSFGIGGGNPARGTRSCNEGPPGVYAKLGANPLNEAIRSVVPQVEISTNVKTPVPGEKVTFTATPRNPDGTGPFGGYDGLAWDLDGDGAFDESQGQTTVSFPVAAGMSAVSVAATSAKGDREIRTVRVITQDRSAVAFAKSRASVRAGRSVTLRITRIGVGAGSVKVSSRARGVGAKTVTFSGTEATKTVRIKTRRSSPGRATIKLGSYSGAVVAGTRTKLTLRIRH